MNKRIFCMLCIGALVSELFSQTYSTSFDLTENPISEGGKWINGGTVGKDWADFKTKDGRATGAGVAPSWCLDNTAILAGTWGPDQTVSVTIYNEVIASSAAEIEIRLRSKISAHVNSGYEILMSGARDAGAYLTVVRWNGAPCDFTFVEPIQYVKGSGQGADCIVRTGDVVKASMIGNEIKVYYNNVLKLTATDNVWKAGAPGIGVDGSDGGAGGDGMGTFGFSDFTVTATGGSTGTVEQLHPVLEQNCARDRHMTILDASGASRLLVLRPDGRAVSKALGSGSAVYIQVSTKSPDLARKAFHEK